MQPRQPIRRTGLEHLSSAARNLYCNLSDLSNEDSVEDFFITRMIKDLGYSDSQIKPKTILKKLVVGRGSKKELYKPDYALFCDNIPRCVIDAKGTYEDLDDWVEQCSGYCLALNRKFKTGNPVKYFVMSNGLSTVCYEWDKDEPLLTLEFSDFTWDNPKYDYMKKVISATNITDSAALPLPPRTS